MHHPLPALPAGRAVIFNGPGKPFEQVTRELPDIKPGEILVLVLYTTLCGSDLHTYCGRRQEPPHVVLGHEIVGEILVMDPAHPGKDMNDVSIDVGDRITWSIFAAPSNTVAPRADMPQKTEGLFKYGHVLAHGNEVFNGGLADYCILLENTAVIKISDELPVAVAATISCAHATVMGAVRVAGEISNRRVMVFGAGMLGLSCVAMCKEAGASYITLIDREESRLRWGEKFGADHTYLATAANDQSIKDSVGEADIVFDMTGNHTVMETGLACLAIGGIAVWVGAVYPEPPVTVDAQQVVRKILQIRGLHNYNYEDFIRATAFIEAHYQKYPFEALVEKTFNMEDIEAAFLYALNEKPVRVGIHVND